MGTGYEQAQFQLDMSDKPEKSDIHVMLPLAHAYNAGLLVQPVDTGD